MNEIEIFGGIGWDVTVSDISRQLRESAPGPLTVRINSPGGSVFDGLAIASMLRRRGDVTAIIDGIAASAASVIAIGAERRAMAPGAFLMIHNPWTCAMGEASDLRKEADVLDSIAGEMAKLYADATDGKKTADEARAMMDAETWLTADQAIEAGLAHAIEGKSKPKAAIDGARYGYHNIPKEIMQMPDQNTEPTPKAGLLDTIMNRLGGSSEALAAKDSELATVRAELGEASAALIQAATDLSAAHAALSAKDAEIETMKADHSAAIEAAKIEASQNAVAEVLAGSAPAPLSHQEPDPSEGALERYNRLHAEGNGQEAFAFYEANQTEIDSARRKAGKE